tara:strand:+ start:1702 stop:2859 length:1158 start_codon:yes stop_codon:yes gene_type:complete
MNFAFLLSRSSLWMGGFNYFINTITYLKKQISNDQLILIICYEKNYQLCKNYFKNDQKIKLVNLGRISIFSTLKRILKLVIFGDDGLISNILHKFDCHTIFFNVDLIGKNVEQKKIFWLPDFQHKELPKNFSIPQIIFRNLSIKYLLNTSDRVVLSSDHAFSCLKKYYPEVDKQKVFINRFRVQKFISSSEKNSKEFLELNKKIRNKKFFFYPMQLHTHKNHQLILDNIAKINKEFSKDCLLIFCGSGFDTNNHLYQRLLDKITSLELKEQVLILGKISTFELIFLYKKAFCVISASEYEGWSTVLEESRLYHVKRLIISDITLHREQLNDLNKIQFFDLNKKFDLAKKMVNLINDFQSKHLVNHISYDNFYKDYENQIKKIFYD